MLDDHIGILLIMLLLGPIQVIWALIQLFLTKNPGTRHHFKLYLLGVVLYFFALIPMLSLGAMDSMPIILAVHFYGGAWGLAIYHAVIVARSMNRLKPELLQIDADGELQSAPSTEG